MGEEGVLAMSQIYWLLFLLTGFQQQQQKCSPVRDSESVYAMSVCVL